MPPSAGRFSITEIQLSCPMMLQLRCDGCASQSHRCSMTMMLNPASEPAGHLWVEGGGFDRDCSDCSVVCSCSLYSSALLAQCAQSTCGCKLARRLNGNAQPSKQATCGWKEVALTGFDRYCTAEYSCSLYLLNVQGKATATCGCKEVASTGCSD